MRRNAPADNPECAVRALPIFRGKCGAPASRQGPETTCGVAATAASAFAASGDAWYGTSRDIERSDSSVEITRAQPDRAIVYEDRSLMIVNENGPNDFGA